MMILPHNLTAAVSCIKVIIYIMILIIQCNDNTQLVEHFVFLPRIHRKTCLKPFAQQSKMLLIRWLKGIFKKDKTTIQGRNTIREYKKQKPCPEKKQNYECDPHR